MEAEIKAMLAFLSIIYNRKLEIIDGYADTESNYNLIKSVCVKLQKQLFIDVTLKPQQINWINNELSQLLGEYL